MSENKNEEYKATVMPREDKSQPGSLPGIVIPENADQIDAFKQINTTSAKDLNAQMEAEAAEKKAAKKD